MIATLSMTVLAGVILGDVRELQGGKVLPHEKYIKVVKEIESPVVPTYVKTKDGLYVAAALRKPKGEGPFPAVLIFHGAPGGRGMEQLEGWSRGATGGPVWERFLQEGYVVAVADYRRLVGKDLSAPTPAEELSYVDDGVAVVDYLRTLPYVDKERVNVYGVSLGGNLALHLVGRAKIKAAVLGAPAPLGFLGAKWSSLGVINGSGVNRGLAEKNVAAVSCPLLIQVGTKDPFVGIDRVLHDLLEKAGKTVHLEIYKDGYHDFVMGPQGHVGREELLLEGTLAALESAVRFLNGEKR